MFTRFITLIYQEMLAATCRVTINQVDSIEEKPDAPLVLHHPRQKLMQSLISEENCAEARINVEQVAILSSREASSTCNS